MAKFKTIVFQIIAVCCLLLGTTKTSAQVLVKDLNTFGGARIGNITTFKNKAFFSGQDASTVGLFVSDATPKGTLLVKGGISIPSEGHFVATTNVLYFIGVNQSTYSLWKSDGTEGGTQMVKTFAPDVLVQDIYSVGTILYISLYLRNIGHELWKSDGTEGGTVKIRDYYQSNANWRELSFVGNINSTLLFMANDGVNGLELWKTSGTLASTTLLKNINQDPTANDGNSLSVTFKEDKSFALVGNKLYFTASDTSDLAVGVWVTDGTETGTRKLKGYTGDLLTQFTQVNGQVYSLKGISELYRLNPSMDTVGYVGDIDVGIFVSTTLFTHQNALHYAVGHWTLSSDYSGLYRWNEARDSAVFIRPFHKFGSDTPLSIGGNLYFIARDSNLLDDNFYLWTSSGTGTQKLNQIPFKADFNAIAPLGNTLLALIRDEYHGEELWKYNPSEQGALPKPKFSRVQNGFNIGFINQSANAKDYQWWSSTLSIYGDTTESPVKLFDTNPHKVVLEAINDIGSTFTADSVILKEGTFDMFPKFSGNQGYATCEIRGVGLNSNAQFYLVKSGLRDISPDSIIFKSSSLAIALFKMSNAPVGKRAIVSVVGQDTFKLADSFDIQPVKDEFSLDVMIDGPPVFRTGRTAQYVATVSNYNNIDAYEVPFVVSGIPNSSDWEVKILLNVGNLSGDRSRDSIYNVHRVVLDTAVRNGVSISTDSTQQVIGLTLKRVPANSSVLVPFTIKRVSGTAEVYFNLNGTVFAPLVDNDSTLLRNSEAFSKCVEPLLECAMGVADLAGLIPGSDCVKEAYQFGAKVGIAGIGAGMGEPVNTSNLIGDAITGLAKCAVSIVPSTRLLKLGKIALDMIDDAGKLLDCYRGGQAAALALTGNCKKKKNKSGGSGGSLDPNSKTGDGIGIYNAVEKNKPLGYYIHFENIATAAFPAEEVLIVDTLDKNKYDFNSLRFTGFGFGDTIRPVNSRPSFFELIDMRPRKPFIVSVTGNLDKETGIIRCKFSTLNPFTLDPLNSLDGFLPPNRTAPEGEGWIGYNILPKNTLGNNDTISNKAAIYFDFNPPIFTNTWSNRIDDEKPNSRVNANITRINDTTVNLSLTGTDNLSGIRNYQIFVSVNDSAYTFLSLTDARSMRFVGKIGKKYKFYSIATDSIGNIEDAPLNPLTNPDATIQLTTETFDLDTEGGKITAYPNPTEADLFLDFDIQKPCHLQWQIFDATGRLIQQKQYDGLVNGFFQDNWRTNNVPKGLYLLSVMIDNKRYTKRIVVQ